MKEKLKKSLTISEKDKKLLVYVFAFLIVFLAYFVGSRICQQRLIHQLSRLQSLLRRKKTLQQKMRIRLSMSLTHLH